MQEHVIRAVKKCLIVAVTSYTTLAECCRCCSKCWRKFSNFFERPFSCWTAFCFLLLGAGVVLCFVFAGKYWNNWCDYNLHIGLLVLGFCYLIENIANFYIMFKYAREYGIHGEARNERDKNICDTTVRFLCYDVFICFYIFFLIFSIVWSSMYLGYAGDNTWLCSYYEDGLLTALRVLASCNIIYIGLSIIAFGCQIMCICIDDNAYSNFCCRWFCCCTCGITSPEEREKQRKEREAKRTAAAADDECCPCLPCCARILSYSSLRRESNCSNGSNPNTKYSNAAV